eukprot:1123714-Prymnesium_polylepis.1
MKIRTPARCFESGAFERSEMARETGAMGLSPNSRGTARGTRSTRQATTAILSLIDGFAVA